jgi:uncharacterized protein (DUF2384 family)
MSTAFAAEAVHVKEVGHLSAADIARATGASESSVRSWFREARAPSFEHAERLGELAAIVERLTNVMSADYIPVWMRKPVGLLDDEKPLDVIAAGDYRRVAKVISGLESMPVS